MHKIYKMIGFFMMSFKVSGSYRDFIVIHVTDDHSTVLPVIGDHISVLRVTGDHITISPVIGNHISILPVNRGHITVIPTIGDISLFYLSFVYITWGCHRRITN